MNVIINNLFSLGAVPVGSKASELKFWTKNDGQVSSKNLVVVQPRDRRRVRSLCARRNSRSRRRIERSLISKYNSFLVYGCLFMFH